MSHGSKTSLNSTITNNTQLNLFCHKVNPLKLSPVIYTYKNADNRIRTYTVPLLRRLPPAVGLYQLNAPRETRTLTMFPSQVLKTCVYAISPQELFTI